MTLTSAHPSSGTSQSSGIAPSFSPTDLSIRDILERWAGTDDTLRAALVAHSALSSRRTEEERTRQEFYRLETRRVEYELLRESLRGGVHPSLIPQLFTQQQEKGAGPQNLSPISPVRRSAEGRLVYPNPSLPSYNHRRDLPRIDTSNLPPPQPNRLAHRIPPSQREKYAAPISAPPASMATTSPPPSIFFKHWALPAPRPSDEQMPRPEGTDARYHQSDHQILPNSNQRSSLMHNGLSPKRGSLSQPHGRQRSEAMLTTKMHEWRHHPYSSRSLPNRRHEPPEDGLGATKSGLDREMVMRALREKVAPRQDDAAVTSTSKDEAKAEKKAAERKKLEQARDVMALEKLVERNGTVKD